MLSTVDTLTFRHPAFLANEQPSSEILMKESGVKEGRCDLTHSHIHLNTNTKSRTHTDTHIHIHTNFLRVVCVLHPSATFQCVIAAVLISATKYTWLCSLTLAEQQPITDEQQLRLGFKLCVCVCRYFSTFKKPQRKLLNKKLILNSTSTRF